LFQQKLDCICEDCNRRYAAESSPLRCECSGLLSLLQPKVKSNPLGELADFKQMGARSGVWRYGAWHANLDPIHRIFRGEGHTGFYHSPSHLSDYVGLDGFWLKHEGENPTGSFKDRGMCVAISVAKARGFKAVACASTGNTSASMASYAAFVGMKAFVFLPKGKIASGKLAQALAYGAKTVAIEGNFDEALRLSEALAPKLGIALLNSINPFRLEGQKTIVFEILEDLNWEVPDWIILPGGNLGNVSAFGKALMELKDWGVIHKIPRLAVIQAAGASPFFEYYHSGFKKYAPQKNPETVATAIRIGSPVSIKRAKQAIENTVGMVLSVTDAQILEAKAMVDKSGIGAEPASCASVAGLKYLVEAGHVSFDSKVVTVLTGNLMKDSETVISECQNPDSWAYNPVVESDSSVDSLYKTLQECLEKSC
jgi:threonine synthase